MVKSNCRSFALCVIAALVVAGATAKDAVLFFGAHPDDMEACMGLALRMKSDYAVHIVDFTRGEGGCGEAGFKDGSTAKKRVAEETEVAKAFGIEPIFLSAVNYQGRYAYANEKLTAEIEELLLRFRPKAVFVHWPVDTHPDHVQCSAAVQHALWNVQRDHQFVPERYFYDEPEWQTQNFRPTYYVDVTAQAEKIDELICKYECQNGAKIARNKRVRMARRGQESPVKVKLAETYSTFSGKVKPGCLLERFAVSTDASAKSGLAAFPQ